MLTCTTAISSSIRIPVQSLPSSASKQLPFVHYGQKSTAGWFEEDRQRFIIDSADLGNFEEDSDHKDVQLQAFFRTELHGRNPKLFSCFLRGVELCEVLHAAVNDPRPVGETHIFFSRYHRLE